MTEAGGRLGKYELRAVLGRGAMGTVWDAWDPVLARRVAVKTVKLPDPSDAQAMEELERFRREAQAAGSLTHPNIVGVYDYGEADGLAWIVMELVDGPTLKALLDKQERMALPQILRVMEDLLAGLAFSHARGVVHRDIKPANIMLTAEGRAKIADFGIARIESSSLTQVGTVMGTPAYMSPEQLMGQTVDARSDIWSAGVVLYQLLSGERPFEGGMTAILHKALNVEPPRPSELSVTAPPALDAVVARALAKRPEGRFPKAEAFATALTAASAAPAAPDDATMVMAPARAAPPPPAPPPIPSGKGAPLGLIAAGVVGLLLLGGGGWFLLRGGDAPVTVAEVAPLRPPLAEPAGLEPPPADAPRDEPPPVAVIGPRAEPPRAEAPPIPLRADPPRVEPPRPEPPRAEAPRAEPPPAPLIPPRADPPPPPAVASPPPSPPAPTPASARAALAAALPSLRCALVLSGPGEGLALRGVVGRGAPEEALRRAAQSAAGPLRLGWSVTAVEDGFCNAIDALRRATPSLGAPGAMEVTLANGARRLRDGDLITPVITGPDFPAFLQVSFLVHDGTVAHLYPAATDAARLLPPGATLRLGDPALGGAAWQVGPPFGTDIVIVVASSVPLFPRPRPEGEDTEAYLRELRAAVDRARQAGARVSADAWALETVAR